MCFGGVDVLTKLVILGLFSFREDLCSGKLVTYADIKYEQACILYNIAALHSILGAMDNRQSHEVSTNVIN